MAGVSFPHRHDLALPRLSGLIAPLTVDDPRTPPRRWWEGDTAVPVCVGRARPAQGGGTSGLTMGWCLALLVLQHAFLPHGGVHLASLPCSGTLHKSHALARWVSCHCGCTSAQRWGMPGPARSRKGPN